MYRCISMACCILLSIATFAQQPTQTIKGYVYDQSSNEPLPFVVITILNTQTSTTTDESGHFEFKNINIGRYNIQSFMTGYEPYILKEIQVSSAKEVFINMPMKESVTTLSEVEIKAKVNKEQALNETATLSARMLSVEEAKRYAGGFDDPARLVSSFAGVSSNVGNNAIVVRGNSPQALQWKLEGVEIPNPNHFADLSAFGGGGLTALSTQVLANSDFFSGAFPAEYNNALSGVFDIFMRQGNNEKREHTFQAGLTGIDMASEGPFKKGKKSSYLFNYRYSSLALLAPILPENGGGVKYQDLSFKLNFPTQKAGVFSLWGIGLVDGSGALAKTDSTLWKYNSDRETQHVKQYMGATGLTHKILLNKKQYVKTNAAFNIKGIDFNTKRLDNTYAFDPVNAIEAKNWNVVLSSFINTKFNARHTNKTGFVATGMGYEMLIQNTQTPGQPLQTITNENGSTGLLAAYSNSTVSFTDKVTVNAGLNTQLFTLNGHYTLEPRIGLKYQFVPKQAFSAAYGLHSRMERTNYYFTRNNTGTLVNQDLDFTKSSHFVVAYDVSTSENTHLKIEAYYQHLFNVPVIKDSTYSLLNQQNDWFFRSKLQNTGVGQNYGIDITFEKYLSKGYYYLLTTSLFNSQYKGDDGVWRSTRYNRMFAFNALIGKEWQTGKSKQNVFSFNLRSSLQGGDHYSPVNAAASAAAQDVVFSENQAFSQQVAPAFTNHITTSYKINRRRATHEIAFKILNATMYKEFMGFQYNYSTHKVDEYREAIFIPNLSYRIEF